MHELGSVTESTASNFGVVSRGAILTPPYWLGLLAGVTREVLFEIAGALGLPMRESPMTRHDIYNAEEAFLTSTLKEVLPVTVVDGRKINGGRPGPVTRRLLAEFRRLVERELG
jgi:branched-chain amino acid aminotransferase